MWEAIRNNQRRSVMLIWVLGAVLVGLGFVIGLYVDPSQGGYFGIGVAFIIWMVMLASAFWSGKEIVLSATHAIPIEKKDHPVLFNIVEEMAIASGLHKMPKIYIIEDDSPNAFAAGVNPDNAVFAVTSGLLRRLSRDELQGVVGHEIGHIVNLDIRFMTIAAVTMGAIVMIADGFLRTLRYARPRRTGRDRKSVV